MQTRSKMYGNKLEIKMDIHGNKLKMEGLLHIRR